MRSISRAKETDAVHLRAGLLLIAIATLLATVTNGRAVTLAWDANTETNIAGYILHYGPAHATYTNHLNVGNVTTNSVSNLVAGLTYYFAVTAYDTSGLESDYSNEVSYSPASNAPPVLTLPGSITLQTGATAPIAGIRASDSDAGNGSMTLNLTVGAGSLTIATNIAAGITAAQVQANGSGAIQINATLGALSATLSNSTALVYRPRLNFAGTDTLTAILNDNGNTGAGGARLDTKQLSLSVVGTSLDVWRNRYFSATYLSDPASEAAVWGDSADPDHDGMDNLMEFALGLNPLSPGSADQGVASTLFQTSGNEYLVLSFKHRKSEPLLQYVPEVSPDLTNWASTTNAVQQVGAIDYDADFQTVTWLDQTPVVPGHARFIRLRIIK